VFDGRQYLLDGRSDIGEILRPYLSRCLFHESPLA
jgi:hypothetical protein